MDPFVKSLFKNSGSYENLDVKLMREYRRRSALWSDFLGYPTKWPFLDIATTLVERGEAVYDTELLEKRLKDLNVIETPFMSKKFAELIVRWESLAKRDHINLPDPFLPFKFVFQRGNNFFGPHGGTVEFAGGGTIYLGPAPNGDLSKVIDHGPWISEEEIAALQAQYP